jgi:hypothetical protein
MEKMSRAANFPDKDINNVSAKKLMSGKCRRETPTRAAGNKGRENGQ